MLLFAENEAGSLDYCAKRDPDVKAEADRAYNAVWEAQELIKKLTGKY